MITFQTMKSIIPPPLPSCPVETNHDLVWVFLLTPKYRCTNRRLRWRAGWAFGHFYMHMHLWTWVGGYRPQVQGQRAWPPGCREHLSIFPPFYCTAQGPLGPWIGGGTSVQPFKRLSSRCDHPSYLWATVASSRLQCTCHLHPMAHVVPV